MMKNNVLTVYEICPEKLKEARIARGYTQSALSRLLGVTRQAISRYEDGQMKPRADILEKYIQGLDFPMQYFYLREEENKNSSEILFRSLATATSASRGQVAVRTEWMRRIVRYFEQYVDFPEVEIKAAGKNSQYTFEEIERLAENLRNEWGLGKGPIPNLTILMQNRGCFIARAGVHVTKSDACSNWSDGRPYVFLTADKNVAVRSRFDLAHELGHLVLHRIEKGMLEDKNLLKIIEKEANHFAGAFLLPRETFGRQIVSTSLEYFIQLKKMWKVSVAAMVHRCEDLGILSKYQTSYLWRQLAAKKMKIQEPLDDILRPEEPTLLKDAAELLVTEKVVTPEKMVYDIALPLKEICGLCNVNESLFSKENILRPRFRVIDGRK